MSKAEDIAKKAYPYPAWSNETTRAIDDLRRNAFIEGYHQAEFDLQLTWEDIVEIDKLLIDLGMMFPDKSTPDYYKEVLKRFKSKKEK